MKKMGDNMKKVEEDVKKIEYDVKNLEENDMLEGDVKIRMTT